MNRYYEKKRHLDVIELLEKKKPWVVSHGVGVANKRSMQPVTVNMNLHACVFLTLFVWYQEYETTRKDLEGVKKEREEVKKHLSGLRQAQAPMLKKIQQIDEQLKPTEAQIKAKVNVFFQFQQV